MPRIRFYKEAREARLLSPLLGFRLEAQPIEFRRDPLTRNRCRINVRRAERKEQARVAYDMGFREAIEGSRKDCFFCPESLEKLTPMFPQDLVPEGRMRRGSSRLFPNLYPFAEGHAIATFADSPHFLEPGQFTVLILKDCLALAIEYLRLMASKGGETTYGSVNWNYGPPAGASVLHPHLQVLADGRPTRQVAEIIKASEDYYRRRGSSYWIDLIEAERELGERLVGEKEGIAWLASYAPQGNNEVLAIVEGASSVTDMDEGRVEAFAEGLSAVLSFYQAQGAQSFNMASFGGPANKSPKGLSLTFKLCTRPVPEPFYATDAGFMERLHCEPIIDTRPEHLAAGLRKRF